MSKKQEVVNPSIEDYLKEVLLTKDFEGLVPIVFPSSYRRTSVLNNPTKSYHDEVYKLGIYLKDRGVYKDMDISQEEYYKILIVDFELGADEITVNQLEGFGLKVIQEQESKKG